MVARPEAVAPPEPDALDPSTDGTPEEPLLLTADEVAALLGVSRSVFYRWDARGDVPRALRIGRMRRWSRLEVIRWVERRCPPRHQWESER